MKQNFARKVGSRRFKFRFPWFDFIVTFNTKWWSKPHRFWFFRHYPENKIAGKSWTVQFPFVEIWSRDRG